MIKLELTVVRMKATQEPVAVFDKVKTIGKLVNKIDEVTTPSDCEYADVQIQCDISIFFRQSMGEFWKEDDDSILDNCEIGWSMASEIESIFNDDEIEWAEITPELNKCVSTQPDLVIEQGDIF